MVLWELLQYVIGETVTIQRYLPMQNLLTKYEFEAKSENSFPKVKEVIYDKEPEIVAY